MISQLFLVWKNILSFPPSALCEIIHSSNCIIGNLFWASMYDAESAVCITLHLGDYTICTVKGENVKKKISRDLFKNNSQGTKMCQEISPAPLHHQQPEPLIRGRMEPCFYVVYNKFGLYHLRVAAQIKSKVTFCHPSSAESHLLHGLCVQRCSFAYLRCAVAILVTVALPLVRISLPIFF